MTSAGKPVQQGLAKPQTKLAVLDRTKQEAFRHEERSNGSGQTFDFSTVEWDPAVAVAASLLQQAGRASGPVPRAGANLGHTSDEFKVFECGHDSYEAQATAAIDGVTCMKEGFSNRMGDDIHDGGASERPPTGRYPTSRSSRSGHDDDKVNNFQNDVFELFDASNETFAKTDSQYQNDSFPDSHEDQASKRLTQFSNLRRPTMMAGPMEPSKPTLKKLTMKRITTRQPRQRSVGSAGLKPGANRLGMKQRRQRSVGVQPVSSIEDAVSLAALNEAEDELWDDDDHLSKGNDRTHLVPVPNGSESSSILGSSMLARMPTGRNPRLAKKRFESKSNDQSEPENVPDKDTATDLHEKVEKNKSYRISIFPKNRFKMNDDTEDISNDGSKHGGVLGTFLKLAFTSDESLADDAREGDEVSGSKKTNQATKLNPRSLFGRSRHAFMESDEVSASVSSTGGGKSAPSNKEEGSSEDEDSHQDDDKPLSTEASVLALIRAKEKAAEQHRPATIEEKVLALIRQREREKAMEDENESFISEEQDDTEAYESSDAAADAAEEKADEVDRSIPTFLDDRESESESPRVSAAENKVLALIKAKQNTASHSQIDMDLREELLGGEDEEDSTPIVYQVKSTEARVLALIKAKQQKLKEVDGNLRAELIEEDISSPGRLKNNLKRSKEKQREHSKDCRSSLGNQSEKTTARDGSSHHHRSSRKSDDGRKTSGSHRASRSSHRRHSPLDETYDDNICRNRRSPRSVASEDDLQVKGLCDPSRPNSSRDGEAADDDDPGADEPEPRIRRPMRDSMAASCHLPRPRLERLLPAAGSPSERPRGVDRSLSSTEHGPSPHRPSQGPRSRRGVVRVGGSAAPGGSAGPVADAALGSGGRRSSDPSGAPPRRVRPGLDPKLAQHSLRHDSAEAGEPRRRSRGVEDKKSSPRAA